MANSDSPPAKPDESEPENPTEDMGILFMDALLDENFKRLAEQVALFLVDSNNDSIGW